MSSTDPRFHPYWIELTYPDKVGYIYYILKIYFLNIEIQVFEFIIDENLCV